VKVLFSIVSLSSNSGSKNWHWKRWWWWRRRRRRRRRRNNELVALLPEFTLYVCICEPSQFIYVHWSHRNSGAGHHSLYPIHVRPLVSDELGSRHNRCGAGCFEFRFIF